MYNAGYDFTLNKAKAGWNYLVINKKISKKAINIVHVIK